MRYKILKHQITENNEINIKPVVSLSFILSLFWSTAPVIGWSYYSLEDSFVACSVEYNEKSINVITYNVGMFTFVFVVPFTLIIYYNVKSLLHVIYFCNFIISENSG
jgi:hypothetical protein